MGAGHMDLNKALFIVRTGEYLDTAELLLAARTVAGAVTSTPQDPRDEAEATIKRLKAAWDSSHQQAMDNGAKYKKAMEALRAAREALDFYDNLPDTQFNFKANKAIRKIKELMEEK